METGNAVSWTKHELIQALKESRSLSKAEAAKTVELFVRHERMAAIFVSHTEDTSIFWEMISSGTALICLILNRSESVRGMATVYSANTPSRSPISQFPEWGP